ncbi:protoporphyrinogen oxidase HemJ [uncultured Umboniibacter sp.]|uniref:protoporphyrinogen oxidase HemJ n=1 Tax=uncultured Umboniibacter sp. TaxID=1798917 RepID=UPI0026022954|nr:protoporphyrinogen oxidase HemJ [uncultured Umboniibacter sp.]
MTAYLSYKALHLIAMVCWFAVLFYLPRLFVYHAAAEDQVGKERFKVMERKLYRGIGTPSMIATLVFGVAMLVVNPTWLQQGWVHAKLTFVALLVIYHFSCGYFIKQFAADNNQRNHVFFRFFNEAPVIALIAIIFLAVLKPF